MERALFAPREPAPLPPDVARDPSAYSSWVGRREEDRVRRPAVPGDGPRLGLVLPLADATDAALARTLRSLRAQTSGHWTLTLVAAGARRERLADRCLGRRARRRVRWLDLAPGASLAALLRAGLASQGGAPAALLFAGDTWAPDAVDLLAAASSPEGVVYADEDTHGEDGGYELPRLKPDYAPDFLLASPYVGRPLVLGAGLLSELPEYQATDSASLEHECALDACERAASVTHVPEVLCHRARPPSPITSSAHIARALTRRHDGSAVEPGLTAGTWRVVRPAPAVRVSVLVPFRDEPHLLRVCVDSVSLTTKGCEVEFVLIDNGSTDPETLTLLERLARRADVQVVQDPRPFNWAELNNAGAAVAGGQVLLFLNNDVEAHRPDWLPALCAHALRPDVAAVGARLLYPSRRVQHCGIVVGMTGAAGHPLVGLPDTDGGYLDMALVTRECSAVTGACLATRREMFDRLSGFDERLGVDLNDVDYCLRGLAEGYRTVYEPGAELLHHESPSRGTAGGVGDIVRFLDRWRGYIAEGDRYFNVHLTRADQSCGLAKEGEREEWNRWYATTTTT